jgi:hypothetical protein
MSGTWDYKSDCAGVRKEEDGLKVPPSFIEPGVQKEEKPLLSEKNS